MSVDLLKKPVLRHLTGRGIRAQLPLYALHAGAFLAGLLGARAVFPGGMRVLGLCLCAALPLPAGFSAAAGAFAGYLSSVPLPDALPYLAGTAAAALMRGVYRVRKQHTQTVLPAAAAALLCCLLRTVLSVRGGAGLAGIAAAAAEALFLQGFCYLLSCFFMQGHAVLFSLQPEHRAARCAAFSAVLFCLSPLSFFGLSPAHTAAACGVLFCLCRIRPESGITAAVCAMTALCAVRPDAFYAGFALCAGAFAAQFFCGAGHFAAVPVFCLAGLSGAFFAPSPVQAAQLAAETGLGAALYFLIPDRFCALLCAEPSPDAPSPRFADTALSCRLEAVSAALCSVGDTMRAVCSRLPVQRSAPCDLCDAVSESCCKSCGKRLYCWVECADEMYAAFAEIAARPDAGNGLPAADLPAVLQRRCQTPVRLASAVSAAEAQLAAQRMLRMQSRETRACLCEQYSAMAAALAQLAGQVYRAGMPEPEKERRLVRLFEELGLDALEISVNQDNAGRTCAAVSLPRTALSPGQLARITSEASALCRCRFAPARCVHSGGITKLLFGTAPCFSVHSAVCSLPADGSFSGDMTRCFADGAGRFHALLCDGMGTGRAAAVGSALCACLAEDLVQSGFEGESAARLVNAALTLKSDDESSVAFDAASVDLYTGTAMLYKAGAAASFVLHEGKAAVQDADTLPIGILGKVTGSRLEVPLCAGDLLVLVSDGALCGGTEAFCRILEQNAALSPEALAQRAAQAAREHSGSFPDDITVLILQLCAAEGADAA